MFTLSLTTDLPFLFHIIVKYLSLIKKETGKKGKKREQSPFFISFFTIFFLDSKIFIIDN